MSGPSSKTRSRWGAGICLLALAGLLVFMMWPGIREPEFQGKPVTAWMDEMDLGQGTIMPGLAHDHPSVQSIRVIGSNAVPALERHLRTGSRDPGGLGRRLLMAREVVRGLLQGQSRVQVWAIGSNARQVERWTTATIALLALGTDQGEGVPRIVDLIPEIPAARAAAANAFFWAGTNDPTTLPHLVQGLDDPRLEVQRFAIEALARLGPFANPMPPVITNLIWDADSTIRNYAVSMLGESGSVAGLHLITNVLIRSPDFITRCVAATALADAGSAWAVAMPALRQATLDTNGQVAAQARDTLQKLTPGANASP